MTKLLAYLMAEKNRLGPYWPEIFIVCIAILLRLFVLEIKPPHFDEGVNGWFADQVGMKGYYSYDPTNYHGPFYFYLVYLFKVLFGREVWVLRMPAVVASILSVCWMFRFSDFFSRRAVRLAAAAMAVSPACVFYGRYSIHESWLVFFTMVFAWGFLGIWKKGTAQYLIAILLGLAGMMITKETWVISITAVLLAFGALFLWQKVVPSEPSVPWASQSWKGKDLVMGILGGSFVLLIFYSGFFQSFSSVPKFFEAFFAWTQTGFGKTSGHEKDIYQFGLLNYYWVYLMSRYEWPALLGLVACIPLIERAPAQRRFLALYAMAVLCGYSMIPYKTPWLILSLLWPLFLLFGSGVEDLLNKAPIVVPKMAFLISLPIVVSLFLCIRLNFIRPTDEREPYAYVQTYPEMCVFTDPLLILARKDPRNYSLSGMILLESYYPLPWVLGDFLRVGYYKAENWPKVVDADFVAVLASEAQKVEQRMQEPYYKKDFRLRSGVADCLAYFRAAVFQKHFNSSPEFIPQK